MKTICIECKFHGVGYNCHLCHAQGKVETDYVTGKDKIMGIERCREINKDGKCKFYRRSD